MRLLRTRGVVGLAAWLTITAAVAAPQPDIGGVGFTSRLGGRVDAAATYHDERGQPLTLRDFPGRPSVLVLGYFRCPNLCSSVRSDALRALLAAGLRGGKDYELVAVSIDPHESASDALYARQQDLAALDAAGLAPAANDSTHWHYLTGDAAAITALSDSVGFSARYNAAANQFAHPPGLIVVTPGGAVSGYLFGLGYRSQAMRDAVLQADRGAIAKIFAPLTLLCFSYDAHTGRYSLAILKVLRLVAVLTVLTTAGALAIAHRPRRLAP